VRSVAAAIAIAAAIAACSTKSAPPAGGGGSATRPTEDAVARPSAMDAPGSAAVDATAPAGATGPVPAEARLLLTSVAKDWDATTTLLVLYRRADAGAPWVVVRSWRGALGKTGLAWGRGLHGDGAPPDHDGPIKREGDAKSPAGAFTLDGSYGYAAAPPAHAALPYTQVDDSWHCVDDPASRSYNTIVDADRVAPDWSSAEDMRRKDVLYTWVIEVGHNADRHPGDGSCIFLHVWRAPGSATVGCTAMAQPDLEALLSDLDPAQRPILVQLTADAYDGLAAAWQLPARPAASR